MNNKQAPAVEIAIQSLVVALVDSKGWMHGYADSIVRDAIDTRTGPADQVQKLEQALERMERSRDAWKDAWRNLARSKDEGRGAEDWQWT